MSMTIPASLSFHWTPHTLWTVYLQVQSTTSQCRLWVRLGQATTIHQFILVRHKFYQHTVTIQVHLTCYGFWYMIAYITCTNIAFLLSPAVPSSLCEGSLATQSEFHLLEEYITLYLFIAKCFQTSFYLSFIYRHFRNNRFKSSL